MTPPTARRTVLKAGAAAAAVLLTGCTPEPEQARPVNRPPASEPPTASPADTTSPWASPPRR